MKDKSLVVLAGLSLVLFALVWFRTDGFAGEFTCGTATISPADRTACITVTTTTATATGGRYDSGDSPLGTAYRVPAGRTLWVTGVQATADAAAATTLTYGYGDTVVANTVAAPAGAVSVSSVTLPATSAAGTALMRIPVLFSVPAGKYLFAIESGPAAWPSRVQFAGVIK